jgi:hypothetical protein
MDFCFHHVSCGVLKTAQLIASLGVMLMLLTFPVGRIHQATDHFRSPEVRRSVERNVFLERTKSDASERVVPQKFKSPGLFLIDTADSVKADKEFTPTPQIPLTRLLLRLKLGPSRSSTTDPLL